MGRYLIDYQINGQAKFFDFFLFVNPLGRKCYYSEQEIAQAKELISSRVEINILCIHNEYILNDFMARMGIHQSNLTLRNEIYTMLYRASLAFKAASMQGKKRGRRFLTDFQQKIQTDLHLFDNDFIIDVAEEAKLDIDLFIDDLQSDYVRDLYLNDLKIAHSMGVKITPSLVIFDSMQDRDGIIVEGSFTYDEILDLLDEMLENQCQKLHHKKQASPVELNIIRKK
ncbi:DsbA family protein [Facklamia sp. DSM 111018]|uniref:DsbA family protein n=1 Tax=Facklamia lactis TaxID=2749967 RepID=A0ABS0LRV9_9LACT|nr:DsbA family protein [Facklamia lactis]MBG9980898.1 DsbA family protein [Facklamia lactis]MBG9986739.1 DsbA family protein [Facklamia lactis]